MLTLNTPQLRRGDIVRANGLRVLLDGDPILSVSHPNRRPDGVPDTYFYPGLVLNDLPDPDAAEWPGTAVPVSWTRGWKRPAGSYREGCKHLAELSGDHRWTIQGNSLAYWSVERQENTDA